MRSRNGLQRDLRSSSFDFSVRKPGGQASSESDLDIMIKLERSDPQVESIVDDIVFEINLQHDTFISTVIFSRKEIEEGPMAESPIYKIIQQEGITL